MRGMSVRVAVPICNEVVSTTGVPSRIGNTLEVPTELDLSLESNLLVLSDMYSRTTMHAIEMRALIQ